MELSELLGIMGKQSVIVCAGSKVMICGLSFDCRRCESGDMFFCKGKGFKKEYLVTAVKKGCVCAVYDGECEDKAEGVQGIAKVKVKDVRKAMALCAAHFYGYPLKRMKSVAVTGTKGKSTVCAYINASLNREKGIKSALLSSMISSEVSHLTTPESIDIHACAARAAENGCTHIVCEVSSQAQKEMRTYGIEFDIGCFINFGCDHISENEHKSEQEYFECKCAILEQCKTVITNTGDEKGAFIARKFKKTKSTVSFSLANESADFYGFDLQKEGRGCDLSVKHGEKNVRIGTRTFGLFGAENALCAYATLSLLGVSEKAICAGIYDSKVGGRGELLKSIDGKITVIVDYAHNEMSFRAVMENAEREFSGAIVTAIFGCPGDKAVCRRAQLAAISARYCDKVIICEDDSGYEGYENIKAQMQAEFSRLGEFSAFVTYIKSREEALKAAFETAAEQAKNSVILLLGKGDERQNRDHGCDRKCTSDVALAQKAMQKYDRCAVLDSTAFQSGRRIVVCTDGTKESASALAFCFLKARTRAQIIALCTEEYQEVLEKECFKHGIALLPISKTVPSREILSQYLTTAQIDNREDDVFSAALHYNATDVVYIDKNGGIITGRIDSAESISVVRAERVLKKRRSTVLGLARNGINVALLCGIQRESLAAYICGGGYKGTVIRAEK